MATKRIASELSITPEAMRSRSYPRIYQMLKAYGHSPFTAATVILDARRKQQHAIQWIRTIRRAGVSA